MKDIRCANFKTYVFTYELLEQLITADLSPRFFRGLLLEDFILYFLEQPIPAHLSPFFSPGLSLGTKQVLTRHSPLCLEFN